MAPESTENNMILTNYSFLLKYIISYTVTDVQNWRDGRTVPNVSSHDHFKTERMVKGSTLFYLFSFYVKHKQQKGNNSLSFMMFKSI